VNVQVEQQLAISLRPMRWWDIPSVVELEVQLFPTDSWSTEQFWEELAQPTRWYVVAQDELGRVVGYAGLFLLAPQADVQTIGVAPQMQGRGVGRLLLQALVGHSRQAGCRRLLLEVRAGNTAAITVYRAAGFTQLSRRSRYYPDGEDAIVLCLSLTAAPVHTDPSPGIKDEQR